MTDPKDFYSWPKPLYDYSKLLVLLESEEGRDALERGLTEGLIQFLVDNPQHIGAFPTRNDLELDGGKEIAKIYDQLHSSEKAIGNRDVNIYYRAYHAAVLEIKASEERQVKASLKVLRRLGPPRS